MLLFPGRDTSVASLKNMRMFFKDPNDNFDSLSAKRACACFVDATLD